MVRLRRLLVALLLGLFVPLVVAEFGARTYVNTVVQRPRLFVHDTSFGWRVRPELDLVRLNADGAPWRVVTDARGLRGASSWAPEADRRLLVLGDSFAFGDGVDVATRFDHRIRKPGSDLSIVNLGVTGYGTGQALLAGRLWFGDLDRGDVVLLLVHNNDFQNVLSRDLAGRSRPWFELDDGGELIEHAPKIGLAELLSDRFFCAGLLIQRLRGAPPPSTPEQLLRSRDLMAALIRSQLRPLADRGVEVIVAHHGDEVVELPFDVEVFFAGLAEEHLTIIDLDEALDWSAEAAGYLGDGNWNAAGHERVAKWLEGTLDSLGGPRTASHRDL